MAGQFRLSWTAASRFTRSAFGIACLGAWTSSGSTVHAQATPVVADVVRSAPVIAPHYNSLLNRNSFTFRDESEDAYTQPVGQFDFSFPLESYAWEGFDQSFRTYCIEPLVPIYAGRTYSFSIDPLGRPSQFGLPDTEVGRIEAEKRAILSANCTADFTPTWPSDPRLPPRLSRPPSGNCSASANIRTVRCRSTWRPGRSDRVTRMPRKFRNSSDSLSLIWAI